jgi:integrase
MKNKKGTYKKFTNGTTELTISNGYDEYGKRIRLKFYGSTEKECWKQYEAFIKEGKKSQPKTKTHTLSAWLSEWLTTYKSQKVQSSTYEEYVYLASFTDKHKIGSMALHQIKPIHVTEFFTSLIDYSHATRKKLRFVINAAFECAVDNDLCTKNPVRRAEIAKKPTPEKEIYSEEEVRTILNFAKTDELFGIPMYILLNSGIRSGELRALSVDRVDFNSGIISIDRAIKESDEIGRPKNGRTRYIPLEPEVSEFLKSKLCGKSGYILGGDRCITKHGLRGRYEWFFKRLNLFLAENGLNPIKMRSPHICRHAFASIRQKHGMPISILMAIMGHNSREMTDHYTHTGDIATLTEAVKKYAFLGAMAE